MAQSGYTPILVYASGTASNVPLAANLTSSASGAELALNYADGKLYFKNSSGVVTLLASSAGASGDVVGPASATDNALARFDLTTGKLIQNSVGILSDAGVLTGLTGLTSSGNITLSALTSGRVPYASTGGLLVDSGNLLYSGADLTVYGVRVGRGAGAVATNTAVGSGALASNATGIGQTAVGFSALGQSTGSRNVAFGGGDAATYNAALAANTSGTDNAAFGIGALSANLTGVGNTSLGVGSLYFSTASNNTAVGFQAGASNQTGANLVLVGRAAGFSNKASNNTFVGDSAGYSNDTGTYNTFVGVNAGLSINTGAKNTIIGSYSGNQGGLDIRTASNYIVLSDGDGNPRAYWNGANPTFPGDVTLSGGTANGVAYLNGSKVLTSGSALWFDGTNFGIGTGGNALNQQSVVYKSGVNAVYHQIANGSTGLNATNGVRLGVSSGGTGEIYSPTALISYIDNSEQMRLNSTGLGIGESSPAYKLDVKGTINSGASAATGYNLVFRTSGITTGRAQTALTNTSGDFYTGIEGSTAGQTLTGSAAYSAFAGTFTTNPLYLVTNGAIRATLDSSGNMGIGTSSPSSKLDVAGAARPSNATYKGDIIIQQSGTALAGTGGLEIVVDSGGSGYGARIQSTFNGSSAYDLSFQLRNNSASWTQRMLLDSSGNLGLGVTPSAFGGAYKGFQIGGNPVITGANAPDFCGNAYHDGTNWRYIGSIFAARYSVNANNGGQHAWFNAPSGTAGNAITFTQAMTLDASGNLQLGKTSSDGYRIGAYGTTQATSGYQLTYGGVGAATITVASGGALVFGYDGSTGSTERARITSGGDLLVGTQSLGGSGGVSIYGGSVPGITINKSASGGPFNAIAFQHAGTTVGTITTTDTATAYNTSSDYRLKDNIAPMTGALAKVAALKPVTYKWKVNGSDGEGFIAHELAEVCPSAVVGAKDAVDAEGKPVYQGIDTSFLVATLTAAIQEQQAIIEQLKAELAALKGA